jgi:hypothetical protein
MSATGFLCSRTMFHFRKSVSTRTIFLYSELFATVPTAFGGIGSSSAPVGDFFWVTRADLPLTRNAVTAPKSDSTFDRKSPLDLRTPHSWR